MHIVQSTNDERIKRVMDNVDSCVQVVAIAGQHSLGVITNFVRGYGALVWLCTQEQTTKEPIDCSVDRKDELVESCPSDQSSNQQLLRRDFK